MDERPPSDTTPVDIGRAGFSDQGKLGPLLLRVYGPVLEQEFAAAEKAGFPVSTVSDELMAADDFYFSTIDLMDCCFLARAGGEAVGAACVNPYVAELQYVAVLPEWRRRGIGTTLVAAAAAEMRKRGLDHMRADVPRAFAETGGLAFLAALGYHEVRRSAVLGQRL
jgi:GNAT superfamily N-acetyltransferase